MRTACMILCLLFLNSALYTQTHFASAGSGRWNDTLTWGTSVLPSDTDDVVIQAGHTVTIDSIALCHHLGISTGAVLTCDSAATLFISGNWMNNGGFSGSQGLIQFNGLSSQAIGGSSVTTFYNLSLSNDSGLVLQGNTQLQGLLDLQHGTFHTAGYRFVLLSDSVNTASIGPLGNSGDIDGAVSVQRYIRSSAQDWRFLGSPVQNATISDWQNSFFTSGFPGSLYPNYGFCSIYSYDETVPGTSDYGYIMPNSASDTLVPGKGYWCWIAGPLTVEVTGPPAKNNQTFQVSLTPSAGKTQDGWNLIANPYASAIDWDAAGWSKTGISAAIYTWDPLLSQYAVYVNGISVNGGSGIIPSSQAFWVQAVQSDAALSCNESVKVNSHVPFQRALSLNTSPAQGIKLSFSGNGQSDETVICLSPDATNGFDVTEDAIKWASNNPLSPAIFTVADSMHLAINSISDAMHDTIMPLYLTAGTAGSYTISHDSSLTLPPNRCIFLEDVLTSSFTDLSQTTAYTFTMNAGSDSTRFLVHISSALRLSSAAPACSYNQNGLAIAASNSRDPWVSTWTDTLGNVLATHTVTGADTLKNAAPGLYTIHMTGNTSVCGNVASTIRVPRAMPIQVHATVQPLTCRGLNDGSINASMITGGHAPYTYAWSNQGFGTVADQLSQGVYSLVLTDSSGCGDTTYYSIQPASPLHALFNLDNDSLLFNREFTPAQFHSQSIDASSLQWNFGDGHVASGSTDPMHNYTAAGTYTIELIAANSACSDTIRKSVYIEAPLMTSMEYMNPTDGSIVISASIGGNARVTFNLPEPANAVIRVMSMDGKTIRSESLQAYKNTEPVTIDGAEAMYLLDVTAGQYHKQHKIIQ